MSALYFMASGYMPAISLSCTHILLYTIIFLHQVHETHKGSVILVQHQVRFHFFLDSKLKHFHARNYVSVLVSLFKLELARLMFSSEINS